MHAAFYLAQRRMHLVRFRRRYHAGTNDLRPDDDGTSGNDAGPHHHSGPDDNKTSYDLATGVSGDGSRLAHG